MAISLRSKSSTSLKQTCGQEGGPAKMLAMQTRREKVLAEREVGCSSSLHTLLESLSQSGLSWKMCQGSLAQTKDVRLSQLSTNLKKSGIWGCGLRATLSTRAFPIIEKEFSLLDLIDQSPPISSILTAANCLGIIRRERRAGRGGKLDPTFRKSLFQTLRFWFSVAEASGIPKQKAIAPRYVPKLENIKAAIPTDQFYVARNLTWTECEKLMGFPEGWTVAEGDSLATQ